MTETYAVTVLDARSLKSVSPGWNRGVNRAAHPQEALRENPSLALASSSFWWLPPFLGSGCITPISKASIFKSLPALSSQHLLLSNLPLPPPFYEDNLEEFRAYAINSG